MTVQHQVLQSLVVSEVDCQVLLHSVISHLHCKNLLGCKYFECVNIAPR